jgi:predicted PurR-regulated permease PerM
MMRKSTILMAEYPEIADYISRYNFNWEQIFGNVYNFLINSGGNMLQSTFQMASSIIGGVIDFFLGFIFAVYILLQKEKLGQQSRKLIYAYLPERMADKIISVCSLAAKIFAKFLSGQCLEAVILGSIFFVAMSIFRFPYALMISVLIGFTALIPVFGAFIGCFVGAFLILIVDPWMALWFILLFFVLQQLEGNFIYPHVVGGSVGLPSMWVLLAVTIGGSTMGVAGMLIFIPMASVLYTLLREATYKRLAKRNIPRGKYNS